MPAQHWLATLAGDLTGRTTRRLSNTGSIGNQTGRLLEDEGLEEADLDLDIISQPQGEAAQAAVSSQGAGMSLDMPRAGVLLLSVGCPKLCCVVALSQGSRLASQGLGWH